MKNQNDSTDPSQSADPMKEKKGPGVLGKIESHILNAVLQGFLQLIPLLVTAIVLLFLITKADVSIRSLPFVEGQPWDFMGIGLLVFTTLFYITGIIGSTRLGGKALRFKDQMLIRIPIVKIFYGIARQGVMSLSSSATFQRVVFLEWPREGMVAMGFVTGRVWSQDMSQSLVVVYIPTVPNPTSGNMAFVVEDDVIETNITVEVAMKLVFSGGIVLPEVISFARVPREHKNDGTELLGQYQTLESKQSQGPDSP